MCRNIFVTSENITGVNSLVIDPRWCLADSLSLLHEAAEGQGAPETLLLPGGKKQIHFTLCVNSLLVCIDLNMCVFIQNIDTLERVAGLEGDDLIEAHGTFYTSHCVSFCCRKEYNLDWMKGVFSFSLALNVGALGYWVLI